MPSNNQTITLEPVTKLRGDFHLPGDKSISHRSAMFATLGNGISRLRNYSSAQDCQSTLECLASLGVKITKDSDSIVIEGVGVNGLQKSEKILDVGNSGTTIRLLSGILAGQNFLTEITGDHSIQRRPMKRIIEPLSLMNARILARENNFAPLHIDGGNIRSIIYQPPIASAQVKSCVLLAGLFAKGTTTVIETTPTRDHTEIMLAECGVPLTVERENGATKISITGGQSLQPLGDYTVAGDLSSAAFFLAAGTIVPNSLLTIRHIGINPSRVALIDVMRQMGASIEIQNQRLAHGEPVADFVVTSAELSGDIKLTGEVIANLIDEIPILAIVATQLHGTLTIYDAHELRVKESDRIRSIVDNLRRMKIKIEEFEDGFSICGQQTLQGATVESYHDHRIAMAFAVAGLMADGATTINGADTASVSLPEFYELMRSLQA